MCVCLCARVIAETARPALHTNPHSLSHTRTHTHIHTLFHTLTHSLIHTHPSQRLEDLPYQEACENITRLRSQLTEAEGEAALHAGIATDQQQRMQSAISRASEYQDAVSRAALDVQTLQESIRAAELKKEEEAAAVLDQQQAIEALAQTLTNEENQNRQLKQEILYAKSKEGYLESEVALLHRDLAKIRQQLEQTEASLSRPPAAPPKLASIVTPVSPTSEPVGESVWGVTGGAGSLEFGDFHV